LIYNKDTEYFAKYQICASCSVNHLTTALE
jgi:hypothetical protein